MNTDNSKIGKSITISHYFRDMTVRIGNRDYLSSRMTSASANRLLKVLKTAEQTLVDFDDDFTPTVHLFFATKQPRPVLDSTYDTWLDALPADVERCDCGKPVNAHGDHATDCQCCEQCGHYPCRCLITDEDDSDDNDPRSRLYYGWLRK